MFIPLTIHEAKAIESFHNVSWRHFKKELLESEIATLQKLEEALDRQIKAFPNSCAFLRLCGRSPKDGEPLDRDSIQHNYATELESLVKDQGLPCNGNTKMIAISRTSTLKVRCGREAMSLLLTSERVYSDMLDWIKYGEPEQVCLRQWDDALVLENEFRVFVFNNKITAISQYDHYTHFPSLVVNKDVILRGITHIWSQVHPKIGSSSYVVDVGYFPNRSESEDISPKIDQDSFQIDPKFIVIEFSPFLPCTGASLFNWTSDIDVLEGRRGLEFRIKGEDQVHPQLDDLVEVNW